MKDARKDRFRSLISGLPMNFLLLNGPSARRVGQAVWQVIIDNYLSLTSLSSLSLSLVRERILPDDKLVVLDKPTVRRQPKRLPDKHISRIGKLVLLL